MDKCNLTIQALKLAKSPLYIHFGTAVVFGLMNAYGWTFNVRPKYPHYIIYIVYTYLLSWLGWKFKLEVQQGEK